MMEELLKAILGGSGPEQASGDPLADLIGSVLGGQTAPAAPQPQQQPAPSSDPLSDLIGSILGGEPGSQPQQSSGSGIIDILGSILGAGRPGGANNAFLQPIASALAEKLGISPQVAMLVINVAIMLLLSRRRNQETAAPDYSRGGTQETQGDGGFNLDDLLDENYLQASGATARLSSQTGMDEDTATRSLQEAFRMLERGQTSASRVAQDRSKNLDDLLDSWGS